MAIGVNRLYRVILEAYRDCRVAPPTAVGSNYLRRADREPISTLAATGRFRSGQTGQTVNLLALRLRWFESSPAQISLAGWLFLVTPLPRAASALLTPWGCRFSSFCLGSTPRATAGRF